MHKRLRSTHRRVAVDVIYRTTMLTSLPGTTITLTTVLPAIRATTLASACAAAWIVASSLPAGTVTTCYQFAVDLHGDFNLGLARKLRIGHGPGDAEDRALTAELLP